MWEPWDEFAHFSYIQHLVEERSFLSTGDFLSNEIVFTFNKIPLPHTWIIKWNEENVLEKKSYNTTNFWDNNDLEEIQKNREAISSQPIESRITASSLFRSYESEQPPLGYLVQVPTYLLFYDQDILTRVFALRIFSVLLFAAAAIVAYKTISLLFDDRFMRLGSLMFIVFNPMYMTNLSRVSNETLTILLFSVFLFLMVLYLKGKTNTLHVVLIGVVLGLGILTKPTFMPAALLVPTFIFLKYIQNNPNKLRINLLHSLKNLGIIFGITVSMGSWWYFEKFVSGNPTGHLDLPGITFDQLTQGIFQIPWVAYSAKFFASHWGFYGMNFLTPTGTYFEIITIMVLISTAGLIYGIVHKIKHHGRKIIRDWRYQSIFAVGLSTLVIFLAQFLFGAHFTVLGGDPIYFGWFAFISITALALVLLLGYRTIIINFKLNRFQYELVLLSFIILIIFNTTTFYWLVVNYYSGFYVFNG